MGRKTQMARRVMGAEWRAAVWAVRHPDMVAIPSAIAGSAYELGLTTTGLALGGVAAGTAAWYRAHPDSFDAYAAPRLRSWQRRWTGQYVGPRWRDLMDACGLSKEHRRSGKTLYPRVMSVRAFSPSIDCVRIKLVKGQSLRILTRQVEEIADALGAERVALERTSPAVVTMIVQRDEPFRHVIPAPDMPAEPSEVDLSAVYMGETEYGEDWTEPLLGKQFLKVGATGSGKNSLALAPMRSVAPMIRDGLVRLWCIDPKMLEFKPLEPICKGGYADNAADGLDLLREFAANMESKQRRMQRRGIRSAPVSEEFPLDWLVIDELGALVAYNAGMDRHEIAGIISRAASMGRATHDLVDAYVLEPNKEIVSMRDLLTRRICLRVNSEAHPDMALGDGARARGAIADQIPDLPEYAGIGFRVDERSRTPIRVRAAYTSDADMAELVEFVQDRTTPLRAVA